MSHPSNPQKSRICRKMHFSHFVVPISLCFIALSTILHILFYCSLFDLRRIMANKRKNKSNGGSSSTTKKRGKKEQAPIPVTILSGFLGSGKTTLLQHILTSKEHKLKIAVIVNDMAELNVDGQKIRRLGNSNNDNDDGAIVRTKKEVITLENGCICCTLRGDLIREIQRVQQVGDFDYVVIESTGIAEPQQVAESFCVDPETQALAGNDEDMLWNAARLDACVTVVDAVNFPRYLSSLKRFRDLFQDGLDDAEEGEGERSISELMVEQVEFANVILLNKTDLVDDKKIQVAKALIQSLNPKAKVVTGSYGKMDVQQILNTQLFSMKEASESPGWLVSLKDGVDASHGEADEYGVSSFVYRSRKPFHPLRLHNFLKQFVCFTDEWNSLSSNSDKEDTALDKISKEFEKKYGSILRSKGTCWIAGRDHHEMGWAQAGRIIQITPNMPWYCKTPPDEWDCEVEEQETIEKSMFQVDKNGNSVPYEYGDRRQEVVLIGTKLQQDAIEEELNKCLLTSAEMQNHSTSLPLGAYPDPLHPILVPCDSSQSVFMIARPGQNQHIRIFPGFVMTIQNIALNMAYTDTAETIRAVKVWLDKTDAAPSGILLATLRPGSHEQHSVSLALLPCDKEGGEDVHNRRIRLEVIQKNSPSSESALSYQDLMMACEVHILGKSEPLPYSAGESSDDDEDGEAEEDCPDGYCD